MKKVRAQFLAVKVRNPEHLLDMMRYDRCYPLNEGLDRGWFIFKQPVQDGIKPGFTLARWESFGIRPENMIELPSEDGRFPSFEFARIVSDREAEKRTQDLYRQDSRP